MKTFHITWRPKKSRSNTESNRSWLCKPLTTLLYHETPEGESILSPLERLRTSRVARGRLGLYFLLRSAFNTGCEAVVLNMQSEQIYRTHPSETNFYYRPPPPCLIQEFIDAAAAASRRGLVYCFDFNSHSTWRASPEIEGMRLVLQEEVGQAYWDTDTFVMHSIIEVYHEHDFTGRNIDASFNLFIHSLWEKIGDAFKGFNICDEAIADDYCLETPAVLATHLLSLVNNRWIRPASPRVMTLLQDFAKG